MRKFFAEMRRRRVWRVAGAYALGSWMVVEVILETAPVLGLPEWVPPVAVILAIVGFPISVLLAWAFDITPQGVVRTPALDPAPDRSGDEGAAAPSPAVSTARHHVPAPGRLAGVFGAGIVVALVGFGAYSAYSPRRPVEASAIRSLAVLPFNDLSAQQDQGYFVDGVAEELLNRLARLQEIRVAARTSSFGLRGSGLRLDEIGRRLAVDAVIEGSVRRDGDRLRITAELVDAASGFQIWSGQYDRTVDDIFAIQDEIAQAIVDTLRVQLVPGASPLRAGTDDVRAHDAYLLGLARWHARTEDDLLRALEYFEEAVRHDDSYAPAHAGLALTYAVLPAYADIPLDVAAERGAAAAARALALDAQLGEGHAAIGQIAQMLEWNAAAAAMSYQRAIQFQPNYATAHQWYAEALMIMGRLAEAEREIATALRLDPLSVAARNVRGHLLTAQRRYEPAVAAFQELVRENPGYEIGRLNLFLLCLAVGCDDETAGLATAHDGERLEASMRLALRAAADGGTAETRAALDALAPIEQAFQPTIGAMVRARLGDRAGAMAALAAAYEDAEDALLPLWLVHPLFDSIRGEPRFREIADELGVEAPAARLTER